MNDIPRGTSRAKLINSLLTPNTRSHNRGDLTAPTEFRPDVLFGLMMTNSRLDDELAVAAIEFTHTPQWLQSLNDDHYGFPKKTTFGTLWRGVDRNAVDQHGQSEFIRAVIDGSGNLHYAEMLAEFADTNVNVQDSRGRTALHWACARGLTAMVRLCLSVPECEIGLKDNDGLTAFDISRRGGSEKIPTLFYKSMFEMEESHAQAALLRVLTVTSVPAMNKPVFPGIAIFSPIEDRNTTLVKALVDRGIDLTARNKDGDTALHVAASRAGNLEIATMLLNAGADVDAIGKGGATPFQYATRTGDQLMIRSLRGWKARVSGKYDGVTGGTAVEDKIGLNKFTLNRTVIQPPPGTTGLGDEIRTDRYIAERAHQRQ